VGIQIVYVNAKYRIRGRERVFSTDRVIQPGFSKAVTFVITSINIVCEPTTLDSQSPDIFVKEISQFQGFKTFIRRDGGYLLIPD
jgi:hypothetical protein